MLWSAWLKLIELQLHNAIIILLYIANLLNFDNVEPFPKEALQVHHRFLQLYSNKIVYNYNTLANN